MKLAAALLALAALSLPLLAAELPPPIPPLTREDARRILEAMEFRQVNVIAVVQGINDQKLTAPSVALVLALGKRDAAYSDLKMNVLFDRELGWFTYESTPKLFRVWTRDGYREIKAGLTF